MGTVTNFGQSILASITAALSALFGFLPALLGAIIVLVIGWILSGVLARLVTATLARVGFERVAIRTGVSSFLEGTGAEDTRASWVIGQIVKWFIRLIFLEAAAQILHMSAITNLLNSIILWIPNLVVALVIVMLGMLLADMLGPVVRGAAWRSGLGNADVMASLTEFGVIAFAVIVALNQVGIAKELVDALFFGLIAALALALGLAFGLGGRETAAEMWQRMYRRSLGIRPLENGGNGSMPEPAGSTAGISVSGLRPATTVSPLRAEDMR